MSRRVQARDSKWSARLSISYTLTLEDTPTPDEVQAVEAGLRGYNRLHAPDDAYRPLTIFLRAADRTLAGGLLGVTYWGWLHVDILWLAEAARRQGFGRQLLAAAEQEALRRGCRHAHLDTLDFQALGFYERQGYRVFGQLDDLPPGHRRYFLQKDLSGSAGLKAANLDRR